MTREDVTDYLSDLVRRRLARSTPYWASEVRTAPTMSANACGRVDFMAFYPAWRADPFEESRSAVELGTFECYEVKSCMDDFSSGHGLNFVGDVNYLVCERDLADELHARQIIPRGVIVICPDKPRKRLITAYDVSNGFRWSRSRTASELLLCLMMSMKRGGVDAY